MNALTFSSGYVPARIRTNYAPARIQFTASARR